MKAQWSNCPVESDGSEELVLQRISEYHRGAMPIVDVLQVRLVVFFVSSLNSSHNTPAPLLILPNSRSPYSFQLNCSLASFLPSSSASSLRDLSALSWRSSSVSTFPGWLCEAGRTIATFIILSHPVCLPALCFAQPLLQVFKIASHLDQL